MPAAPLAYFLTFSTYGARLHGDPRGSVTRNQNQYGARLLEADPALNQTESDVLRVDPVKLSAPDRSSVLQSVRKTCQVRDWQLEAVHIRTNHAHVVLASDDPPSKLLQGLKAHASRSLNSRRDRPQRWWAAHGSTIYLWRPEDVHDAVEYVIQQQGAPMAAWLNVAQWPNFAN